MRPFSLLLAASLPFPILAAPTTSVGLRSIVPNGSGAVMVELVATGANVDHGFVTTASLPAALLIGDRSVPVTMERVSNVTPDEPVGQARYRFRLPAGDAGGVALLAIPSLGISGAAFDLPPAVNAHMAAGAASVDRRGETISAPSFPEERRNAFLNDFSPYRAFYAAYGPGTASSARIQLSFKYQPFGRPSRDGAAGSWLDGITFGYTQRIFWDVEAKSAPIRDVDYMPELFYLIRPRAVSGTIMLGGQGGFAHESNGRGGTASRSINMVYLRPEATVLLGAWQLTVGPRLWTYVGSRTGNTDIAHYRGHTGLFAAIGQDDGLRLTTEARLNPGSGRGAAEAELSYPLAPLLSSAVNLYIFGQGFTGYGENLLDYNRRQTRLRMGLGLAR